jgi:hypothetical protein
MKNIFFIAILGFISCNNSGSYEKAEDAQDAGRQFIRATLDGEHEKAKFYLLQDTTNLMLLKQQETNYNQLSGKEKNNFRESSIRPVEIKKINDSVTLYKYFNTFHSKDTTTLRIIRLDSNWVVDLKSIIRM